MAEACALWRQRNGTSIFRRCQSIKPVTIILWGLAMHEASVANEILEIVQQAADAGDVQKVTAITLQIGTFSCIQPDLLQVAFDVLSRGTLAQGATLEIEWMPAKAWCSQCQQEYEITFTGRVCPTCGVVSRQITGGREALVKSIEGE